MGGAREARGGPGPEMKPQEQYNARYVWLLATVAALGGLLFGYDWVVIGGAKPFYEKFFQLSSEQQIGWANSCALLGCLLGSLLAGAGADRFGRKKLLIASAVLFAVSSVLTGWAATFTAFVVWRIAGGVAIGIASNVSPVYIAEISPAPWRGRLVSMNQMTIVVGILAAQIVNWLIAETVPAGATAEMIRQSWNGQFGWRWMFTAVTVPSLVFFLGALLVPESPRWLAIRGQKDRARRTLARIGGEEYADRALADVLGAVEPHAQEGRWAELLAPGMLKVLGIGVFLAVLQQWSGINVIFNYAEEIYRNAGYGVSDILFNIVITGSINLVFTLVALGFVDRLGRRVADAGGLRRRGGLPLASGALLPFRAKGHARSGLHSGHDRLLRDVPGAGDMGAHLGDLPEPHSRRRGIGIGVGAVDRVLRAHVHVPGAERGARSRGDFLAVFGYLRHGVSVHTLAGAGDQREDARTD